jgi:putative ABC transport system ATP-binding protein
VIRLQAVRKEYQMGDQTVHALQGVDLHIRRNELVAFIGASGSGKSTMMNIVGCLDRPSSGEYWLNGREVATMSGDELALVRNQEIGFIFQSFHLLPRASALDNVAQPLIYRGIKLRERLALAEQALTKVGLGTRLHHRPNELSGGQRQRVAIARALVGKPSILLADEPTGNLDSKNAESIMQLLCKLHEGGATICMVTHDPRYVGYARRIVELLDGRVIDDRPSKG